MAGDMYGLLWERELPVEGRGRRPGRPSGLSRERIVAEATAIADAEGLHQVSMKRIADGLDCGVMSLYRHVPGKDELVALMYDATMADAPPLPEFADWRDAMHAWAMAVRTLFRAHPWALPLATANHMMGPGEAYWLDWALGVFTRTGLDADVSLAAVLAVNGYVGGALRPELQGQDDPQWFRFMRHPAAAERFPNVQRLIDSGGIADSPVLKDSFEFGLGLVLDGLERYIETRPRPGGEP
ncbi:TetR/AcrR family transcriptional regulator [Glycomyces paridis]|uniref:TetR/AcrR family transcriptional regulator n=1 Tax=Glycomyces paridis TaxID=2126555 RepID=A0A4V4HNN4_9ACTN|nr:TetR/AcrR family transcriptional regulator [Glycomyces paridis]THV26756.1 TetR/AcrR family transcriptional regulator [Glycomyces paridis]